MSVLLDTQGLKTPEFPAPRQGDSKVSLLRKGHNWLISASGGVAINSWGIVQHIEQSDAPAALRAKTTPPASRWCSN
jgi:hypothetical protein